MLFEQGQAHLLSALHEISPDFDILISCVDTQHEIIPTSLLEGQCNKIFVDLAIQSNIPVTEKLQKENHHINIDGLRDLAHENMQLRKKEIAKAKTILTKNQEEFQLMWKQRKVTNAMAEIPLKIKDIKHKAIENVFQAEIVTLNTTEGAAYGAALLATVGGGQFADVAAACQATIYPTSTTKPGAAAGHYEKQYQLYRSLYPALQATFQAMG